MTDENKYHNGQYSPNGNFNSNFHTGSSGIDSKFNSNRDEIDFKQLFHTLWNRKWTIVATTALCGFLALLAALLATPIYQSEGSMLIQDSKGANPFANSQGIGQVLSSSYGLGTGSTIENELQVLRSRKLSMAIADTLIEERIMSNGRQYPVLFKAFPDDSTLASQDTVALRIRNNIVFNQVDRNSDVVSINYESRSPYEAGQIVDFAMVLYKYLSTQQNRISASSAVQFLERERERIQDDLEVAERRLRGFMNESQLVQVEPQTEKLIDQMAKLEGELQGARANLVATNSAIENYEQQLNSIKPGLAEQYSEAVGPKMSRFQYQLAELETQKERLLTNNPELRNTSNPPEQLQKINREIASFQRRIRELTNSLINQSDQYLGFLGQGESGIAQNVSELNRKIIELQVQQKQYEAQIDVLEGQLSEQEQFFNDLPDNIIDLAQLKRDVKINEELFVTVSQQYAETALWEQTQFGLGRIVDTAYIPEKPIKPNKTLYVLVGLIIGGILSVGYVLVKDSFNDSINGVEKLRSFGPPVLSVIPEMRDYKQQEFNGNDSTEVRGQKVDTGLVTILNSISPIAEAYRRLQNNIIYSNPDKELKSIMVTSSGKGEGKTTTISNLGVTLSEAGYKTIIVDTDLRRPNLHNMFGHSRTPGVAEVLFDNVALNEVVRETINPGLNILTVGRELPNPSAITQSRAFLDLIANLEAHYDIVLIDTPPMGIITDASALIQQSDGIVVVARFNKTNEPQLNQVLEQLDRLNASILGTVLTAFDYRATSDIQYGSSYYRDVYREYSEYSHS